MNEVQESVASRFGPKTRVSFTTSPGYASMPPALQFVYAKLILIAEGNAWRVLMAAPNREIEPINLRLLKSELAAAWTDVSHASRGFYELADILMVLDEVLLLEISNLARQLKFNPEIGDGHPAINHFTAILWFRSMALTITSSTSNGRAVCSCGRETVGSIGIPSDARERQVAVPDTKARECHGQDAGECTTPHQAGMGVSREIIGSGREQGHDSRTIRHGGKRSYHWGGFWREHARGDLKTRKDHEILKFLSPCWEKRYIANVFYARDTISDAFVQELLHMPINLLSAL